MTSPNQLKLYSLASALTPPRILIYLREKRIPESAVEIVEVGMTGTSINISTIAKNNPSDAEWLSKNAPTVPVLEITHEDGSKSYICDSIAIFTYLELVFPPPGYKTMSGTTAFDRARHAEILALLGEIALDFSMYAGQASKLFSDTSEQDTGAAKYLLSRTKQQMKLLENKMNDTELFLIGKEIRYADCVAFATFQYAINWYGLTDFLDDYPSLAEWYAMFSKRESVNVVQQLPEQFKAIAKEMSVR